MQLVLVIELALMPVLMMTVGIRNIGTAMQAHSILRHRLSDPR
jgi:hypothetical protein